MTRSAPAGRFTQLKQALLPLVPDPPVGARVVVGGQRHRPALSAHQLRFLALPSSARPRALLPVPIISGERAALLKPRTTMLTLRQRLVQAGINSSPSRLLRATGDVVTLSLPHPSPLVEILRSMAPALRLGIVISPTSPDRPAYHLFDDESRLKAIGKFSTHDGRRTLDHEYSLLRSLAELPTLADSVPRALALHEGAAGTTLITDAFSGEVAPVVLTSAMERWLGRCTTHASLRFGDSSIVQRTIDELRQSSEPSKLVDAVTAAADAAREVQVPRTIVHGDFVPWNMVLHAGEPRVFDWEFGCIDGVPGWDRLHFELQVSLLKHRADGAAVIEICRRVAPQAHGRHVARAVASLVLARLVLWQATAVDSDARLRALSAGQDWLASNPY